MKEFTLRVDETINKGLRPYEQLPLNSIMLEQAKNVEVTEVGLQGLELPTQMDSYMVYYAAGFDFPFPQLFNLKTGTYVFGRYDVYKYENGNLTKIEG